MSLRGRFVTGSVILSERNTVVEFHNNYYRIILEILNKVSINETKSPKAAFQKIVTMFPQNQYLIIFKKL